MRCDLSCYWVFHCFLTLSFALLGAIATVRYLGKLFHSLLLSKKTQTVILFPKTAMTTKSLILQFALMWIHNTPSCLKKGETAVIQHATIICIYIHIPATSGNQNLLFVPAVHMILSQNIR